MLYNYDVDRDDDSGLLIAKGGSGADESDPTKYQAWRTLAFDGAVVIEGDAKVHLWSGMKDFGVGLAGVVTVYLRDCDGWDCVELGSDTLTDENWQGGSNFWRLKTFSVPVGTYTLAPGRSLELVVVVDASSDDDMWFAYDINPYKSRLSVSASSATTGSGAVPDPLVCWLAQTWARWLFA